MTTMYEKIMYWKLAIFKCSGKAMMALLLSIVSTLNGVNWSDFTGTQKFVAICTAIGAMWTVIDAFLSDTMARLQDDAGAVVNTKVATTTVSDKTVVNPPAPEPVVIP